MKQILPNPSCLFYWNLKKFVLSIIFFLFVNLGVAQSSGIFESYAILSFNGGANEYFDMQASTGNTDLQGANFGTATIGTTSLVVKGGQNKTYKNGGCNINSSTIFYRVYKTGDAPGAFASISELFLANLPNPGDQSWEGTSGSTNLILGLTPGSYTLEMYSSANFDSCGTGTHFSNNSGANYKATFTVVGPISVTSTTGTATTATYANVASAITAINGGVLHTGTIVCSVPSGYTEMAPVGGFAITASGTASNTISFVKTGAGTNPIFTANSSLISGTLTDAVFKIIGGDYITIDGFTMLENSANTITTEASNNMTEFGIALFYASTTNGCQNVTIKNNSIDLNRFYQNTIGIYAHSKHTATNVTTSATATGPNGGNHNLSITANAITDVNQGILVFGPTAAADHNNGLVIGGSSADANTITNFGTTGTYFAFVNSIASVNAISIKNTKNFNVSYNTIVSSNGGVVSSTLRGICIVSFSTIPTGTFTNTISNNNLSVTTGAATGNVRVISVQIDTGNNLSTMNIHNNDFYACGHNAVSPSGSLILIYDEMANLHTNVNGNTFTNLSPSTSGNVTLIDMVNTSIPSGGSQIIQGNSIVTGLTKTGIGGILTFILSHGSSNFGNSTWSSNNFSNVTVSGSTVVDGIFNSDGGSVNQNITSNTINNIIGGSGKIIGIKADYGGNNGGSGNFISTNNITNISSSGAIDGIYSGSSATRVNILQNTVGSLQSSGAFLVSGINSTTPLTIITRNKIYDLTSNNSGGSVNGILATITNGLGVNDNLIGDLKTPQSSGLNLLVGINIFGTGGAQAYHNTVYLNSSSSGAEFGSSAISVSTLLSSLFMASNILVNNSTVSGSGMAVAYRRSSTDFTNYNVLSNNNLFAASTIFSDGTNADTSLWDYKTRARYANSGQIRENASVTENPHFLSLSGSNSNFLHIDPTFPTYIESGGRYEINGYGNGPDYDGDIHYDFPDIGADEGTFLSIIPTITGLTPVSGCVGTSVTLTGTGMLGVNRLWIGSPDELITNVTETSVTFTAGSGTSGLVHVKSGASDRWWNNVVSPEPFTFTTPITYYVDNDNDGFGSNVITQESCTGAPVGYVSNNLDCNDNQLQYYDADGDSFGSMTLVGCGVANNSDCNDNQIQYLDADGDGFGANIAVACGVTNNGDCNDNQLQYYDADGDSFGSMTLVGCGVTNNSDCNDNQLQYLDADGDGFGSNNLVDCGVTNNSDCYPGTLTYVDADGDGYGSTVFAPCGPANNTDCNDNQLQYLDADGDGFGSNNLVDCGVTNNSDCYPETVLYLDNDGDGLGSSVFSACTGVTNNSDCNDNDFLNLTGITYYQDADGDGYGNPVITTSACVAPVGYVLDNSDCNDALASINPGATEICYDGIDQNCDGNLMNSCAVITAQLRAENCGSTLTTLNQVVRGSLLSQSLPSGVTVTGYRFRVTNLLTNAVRIVERSNYVFQLSYTDFAEYNTPYSVEVAVRLNQQWMDVYGPACTITTPDVPNTVLAASSCGATLAQMNNIIRAVVVPSALQYDFEVSLIEGAVAVETTTLIKTGESFNLLQLSGISIKFGAQYSVRVKVQVPTASGPQWSTVYGAACSVFTPLAVEAAIEGCGVETGIAPAAMTTLIYATPVGGATQYKFTMTDGMAYTQTYTTPSRYFKLSNFNTLQALTPGGTYSVTVEVQVYGFYYPGKDCNILVPGGAPIVPLTRAVVETNNTMGEFKAVAYPNPYGESFALNLISNSTSPVSVAIYDMAGRLLETREFNYEKLASQKLGERYPSGVYSIIVNQDEETQTIRVVKK